MSELAIASEYHAPAILTSEPGYVVVKRSIHCPKDLGWPVTGFFWQLPGEEAAFGSKIEAFSVRTGIKSGCVPLLRKIDHYRFLQWKGVGRSRHGDALWLNDRWNVWGNGLASPLPFRFDVQGGASERFPIFSAKLRPGAGKSQLLYTRIFGGAFHDDILREQRHTERLLALSSGRFRTPLPVAFIKFPRITARTLGLPLPDNDDPECCSGERMNEYIWRCRRDGFLARGGDVLSTMPGEYWSGVLGQNMRLFRNVWRFEDLEFALFHPRDIPICRRIIDQSITWLAQEFESIRSYPDFCDMLAKLLGEQAAVLLEQRVVHGALHQHKQDVTLAGEVADFDSGSFLADYSTSRERTDLTHRMYRQIFLLANHLQTLSAAGEAISESVPLEELIDIFVESLRAALSSSAWGEACRYVRGTRRLARVKDMVGKDPQKLKNLGEMQKAMNRIKRAMRPRRGIAS